MTPAIMRSVRVCSRFFFAAFSLTGFAALGLSLSMRFVIMSSASMTKNIIVARAYIFGVTVFFVML